MGNGCHHRAPLQEAARPARSRLLRSCAAICVRRSMVIPPVGPLWARLTKRGLPHEPTNWRIPSGMEQSRALTFSTTHNRGMHGNFLRLRSHGKRQQIRTICRARADQLFHPTERPATAWGRANRRRAPRNTAIRGHRAPVPFCRERRLHNYSRPRHTGLTGSPSRTDTVTVCSWRLWASRAGWISQRTKRAYSRFMCLSPAVLFRVIDRSSRVASGRPRDGRGGRRPSACPTSLPAAEARAMPATPSALGDL